LLEMQTDTKRKPKPFLHEYCKVLYNRHPTFRREVREGVGNSKILVGMRGT
jgi:hypothetical protein